MEDKTISFVEGFHHTGNKINLNDDRWDFAWQFALNQRLFGPRQLVVITAGSNGDLLGVAHCKQAGSPEVDLKCCLACSRRPGDRRRCL